MPGGFGSGLGPGNGSPGRIAPNGEFYNYNANPPSRTFGPGWTKATAAGRGFTSAVVPLPTEALNGLPLDTNTLLVMWCAVDQGTTVTTPGGWTISGAGFNGGVGVIQYTFYKVAAITDAGSSVTVTYSSSNDDFSAVVLAVPGVNTSAPVTTNFTKSGTGVATITGPTLTGIGATDIIVECASARPTSTGSNLAVTLPGPTWNPTTTVTSTEKEASGFPSATGAIYQVGASDSPTWTYSQTAEIAITALQLAAAPTQTISPVGIPTSESFGSVAVTTSSGLAVSPAGIPSSEAFGSPAVTPGSVTVSPSAIPSSEGFGAPTVSFQVVPTGIGSAETVGAPNVQAVISPVGVPTAERLGTVAVTTTYTVSPSAISSSEAVGQPIASLTIAPAGIGSGETLGSPIISATASVNPVGVSTAERFGSVSVGQSVSVAGVPSSESFGSPAVSATYTVSPTGIPSQQSFGTPQLSLNVAPTGIPSREGFGNLSLSIIVAVNAVAIPSAESFGSPVVTPGSATLSPAGIKSVEGFGTTSISQSVSPTGIPSRESFGNPTTTPGSVTLSPAGLASSESLGSVTVSATKTVSPSSISISERFGVVAVSVTVSPTGIASTESFGSPSVRPDQAIKPAGLGSQVSFGNPLVGSAMRFVFASSIASSECVATPRVYHEAATAINTFKDNSVVLEDSRGAQVTTTKDQTIILTADT